MIATRSLHEQPDAWTRKDRTRATVSAAVASSNHGTNGNQIRSTSALDIPLRSATRDRDDDAADEQPGPPIAQAAEPDGGGGPDRECERREVRRTTK